MFSVNDKVLSDLKLCYVFLLKISFSGVKICVNNNIFGIYRHIIRFMVYKILHTEKLIV